MKKNESLSLRFLYHTSPGRAILKVLTNPVVSEKAAVYLSSPYSKWLIDYYKEKYNIDMTDCCKKNFSSFNDFFKRKKKLKLVTEGKAIISPCDAFLSIYSIDDDLSLNIKHSRYTVSSLLRDRKIAEEFSGGICCVFRLEPHHYHRYLFAVNGRIKLQRRIKGILHCVRPIACQEYPVHIQNSRQYTLIQNSTLGNVIQMEIGAMLVGKICNHMKSLTAVKGQEKGYFEYGGSTIVLLFQKNSVNLSKDFMKIMNTEIEVPVNIGQTIGKELR